MATEYVTHRDLETLRAELRGEFALVRGEMKDMRGELLAEIAGQTRTTIYACIGAMLGFGGIVIVAGQLA